MSQELSRVFIARQPIFDAKKNVMAYELLFRSGVKNSFDPSIDPDFASRKMMGDTLYLWGMDSLIGGHKAFVNLTENVFLSDIPFLFDKNRVVIELLETITPTPDVLDRCRELKDKGYTLAMDDFVGDESFLPLMEQVDIVKVDFLLTNWWKRKEISQIASQMGKTLLAEKVETVDVFKRGSRMGYELFQGYFFSRPEMITGRDIPSQKLSLLQLVEKVNNPELNFNELNDLISQDVSLSYKLMRFINSVSFGLRKEVKSIRHALVLLGEDELRKWISLISLSNVGSEKPHEMLVISLCRAVFLMKLAELTGLVQQKTDLFLAGLFSMIDGFLDQPMEEIVTRLPLNQEVKSLLCGEVSTYQPFFEVMFACETGDWTALTKVSEKLQLDQGQLSTFYHEAMKETMKIQEI